MKKLFAVLLTLMMSFSALGVTAFAAETQSAEVYVTIVDNTGKVVVEQEKFTVTDVDSDNALTMNDALYIAHEEKYTGKAAAGYATSHSATYGTSFAKLWGDTSGGFGYFLNNEYVLNLDVAVQNGDRVNAFVYTQPDYSDKYSFFDVNTVSATAGSEIELKLSANAYDASWNPIVVPVANAVITVNGERSTFKTDSEGKLKLTIASAGDYIISAVSDTEVIVPAVLRAAVSAAPAVDNGSEGSGNNTAEGGNTNNSGVPATGETSLVITAVILMSISLALLAGVTAAKKKSYEK